MKYLDDFNGKIIIPFCEAEKISDAFDKSQIILEIPFLVYPDDEDNLVKHLTCLYEKGFLNVICENISFVSKMREIGFIVFGGAYMNVINPLAASEYEEMGVRDMTLSVEINNGDLLCFDSRCKIGIISYGFLPLMQFRSCPLKAHLGCEKCGGNGEITDRLNNRFSVLCRKKYVSLLNTVPISLSGKKLNVDFQTLYFTKESPLRVSEIVKDFINNKEPDYSHTKGLYFRKVL
jgi:collagenase-like PrtC family protease